MKILPAFKTKSALIVGFILVIVVIGLWAFLSVREALRKWVCEENLEFMGLIFKMYDGEQRGTLPILSPDPGKLMFSYSEGEPEKDRIYPGYITKDDLYELLCPGNPNWKKLSRQIKNPAVMLDDHSYFYLGYAVTNDEDMDRFAEAYRKRLAAKGNFEADLQVDGHAIPKLHEGSGNELPIEQHKFPLLIERLGHHYPVGGNVLFMDGSIEYMRYPGRWPMTEHTVAILQALDGNYWPPRAVSLCN